MTTTLTIRDETSTGELVHEMALEFVSPTTTARELIQRRVRTEVEAFNRTRPGVFRGLVQPKEAEATLNGYRLKKPRDIDWEVQLKRALEAFENNQMLMLVDDRQIESLDETIELTPETEVRFLRLVLLVGG